MNHLNLFLETLAADWLRSITLSFPAIERVFYTYLFTRVARAHATSDTGLLIPNVIALLA